MEYTGRCRRLFLGPSTVCLLIRAAQLTPVSIGAEDATEMVVKLRFAFHTSPNVVLAFAISFEEENVDDVSDLSRKAQEPKIDPFLTCGFFDPMLDSTGWLHESLRQRCRCRSHKEGLMEL
jgi:hypothetical protein